MTLTVAGGSPDRTERAAPSPPPAGADAPPDSERPPPEDRRVASPVLNAGSAVRNWDGGDESGSVEKRYSVRERRAPDWFGF